MSSSSSSSSLWLPDGSSDVCMLCKISFDILIRRHHCRKCGGIYCGGCCSNYMKLPMNLIVTAPGFDRATMDPSLPVRCCNKCKQSSIRPLPIQSDQQQQVIRDGPRPVGPSNNLVEVNALEFLPGDHYKRYLVVVPIDIRRGQTFRVSLDGRLMTVAVPDNVSPGDAIYVRAPIFSSAPTRANATTIKRKVEVLACSKCTFENNPAFPTCQICGNDLSFSKDAVINTPQTPKTNVLELNDGEATKQYYVIIPFNVNSDEVFQVSLDGRIMSVLCPDNAKGGDKIIVVGPDPEFLPPADVSDVSTSKPSTEADIVIAHHMAALMKFLKIPPSHLTEDEFVDILLASGLTSNDIEIARRSWGKRKEKNSNDNDNSGILDVDSFGALAECTVISNNNDNSFRTSNSNTGYPDTDGGDDDDEIKENDKELKQIIRTNSSDNDDNDDSNEDPGNEQDVQVALKRSLSLTQERPLDFHAHLFTKRYDDDDDDDDDDEAVKVDAELKSIFDTKKKNDNSTNKGIEDRQKRIDRIKQDVDETVVTFSKAIAKANDTSTKASGTIAKANDTSSTKASGTIAKANDTNTKANDTNTNSSTYHNATTAIECHRCTYHNATTAIECNMCGMTLETYYKNSTSSSSSTKKENNNVKFASASVAIAAQLPPSCVVESILRDDDDDESRFAVDGAVVDFPIRCPICTLDNHPGSSSCEACGSELTSDSIGYQRITQVHNTSSSSKKKRNSNNSNNSNNNNNNSNSIPEAIVIPMSGNGINIVEAFPIDDQHR